MSGDSTTRSVAEGGPPSRGDRQRSQSASHSTSSLAATQTVVAPQSSALVRIQGVVIGVLLMLAVLGAARLWLMRGLTGGVRIDGPSMAPALVGGHYPLTCQDCGFAFRCDAEDPPASGLATCPNCGFRDNPLREQQLALGELVLLDRFPLLARQPRRGEIVAAGDPKKPGEFVVKRVAALPGERWAIRNGDLVADDRLVRKTLRELAAVRIVVHDSRFVPHQSVGLPERWQSTQPGSGWHRAPTGYRYEPPQPAGKQSPEAGASQFDWLVYHHWMMFAAHSRTKLSPIHDTDSYNQNTGGGQNAVPDVQIACRLRAGRTGRLAFAATDDKRRFEAVFNLAKNRVQLLADGSEVGDDKIGEIGTLRGVRVEFGLCDQQVLLSIGGREIFRFPYNVPDGPRVPTTHALAIGAGGAMLDVADLVVWRDLYYLHPRGSNQPWQSDAPLGPAEFALLGDNTTISTDSRAWPGGVPASELLGTVYPPFWASRSSTNPR